MSRTGCDAGSPIIGFIASIFVFSLVFATVVEVSISDGQQKTHVEEANYSALASSLASLIFSTPGRGWYEAGACSDGALNASKISPDGLTQFALGEESCGISHNQDGSVNNLSFDKIQKLFGAQVAGDPTNKLVDYGEARASLKLETLGLDFHLRTAPVLPGLEEVMAKGFKDPNMRPAYVGDYEKTGGGGGGERVVQHSKGAIDGPEAATVFLNLTNNGTVATVLAGWFSVPLKSGNIDFTLHTPELAVGQNHNITFPLRKSSDWEWNDPAKKWVDYEIMDKDGSVGPKGTISMASVTMTTGVQRNQLFIEAEKLWVKDPAPVGGEKIEVHYASYDGQGKLAKFSDWTMRFLNPDGTIFATRVLPNNKDKGFERFENPAQYGKYTAELWNDALTTRWGVDAANLVPAELPPFTSSGAPTVYGPQAPVAPEMNFLDFLVEKFDANVYSSTYDSAAVPYALGGDVFPDLKDVLDNDLKAALTDASGVATLAKYNVLLVGSNVNHQAMTSQAAKGSVKDWVFAGGTLIVLGSASQAVHWLVPLFQVALETASGGISTPDAKHPILRTPNALDYVSYDNHGMAWDFKQQSQADHFTHVVVQGADDILAVSDPGEFGKGRVILTSWMAFDLLPGPESGCTPGAYEDTCQGLALFHNLVTMSYQGLFLDYGPAIPTTREAGVQTRILTVYHPQLATAVELRAQVFVFN